MIDWKKMAAHDKLKKAMYSFYKNRVDCGIESSEYNYDHDYMDKLAFHLVDTMPMFQPRSFDDFVKSLSEGGYDLNETEKLLGEKIWNAARRIE